MLGMESCLRGEREEGRARAPALSVRRTSGWKCIVRLELRWMLVGCYEVV